MQDEGEPRLLKRRQSELICREVEGKLVGLDLRSSRYFSLNPTGTKLWRLLDSGALTSDLVDALVAEHGIDPSTATDDVAAFIKMLDDQSFLE